MFSKKFRKDDTKKKEKSKGISSSVDFDELASSMPKGMKGSKKSMFRKVKK